MKIGNLNYVPGAALDLNKWYVWFEISHCHPTRRRVFKPYFFFGIYKIIQYGTLGSIGTSIKKGFYKRWEFPIGIAIEIIK